MLCPWCHAPNRENAKFCKGCGQLLAVETVAGGQPAQQPEAQPSVQETQQAQVKEETPAFIPAPPGATPPPPPPESLGAPTAGNVTPLSSSTGAPGAQSNDLSQEPTQVLTPEQMEQHRLRRRWQDQRPGTTGVGQVSAPFDISEAPTILAPFPPTPAPAAQESSIEPTVYAGPPAQESSIEPTVYAGPPAQQSTEEPTVYAAPDNSSEPTIYAGAPQTSTPAAAQNQPSASAPSQQSAEQSQDIADMPTIYMPLPASSPSDTEASQGETPAQAEAQQQTPGEQTAAPEAATPEKVGEEEPVESEENGTTPEQQPQSTSTEDFPVLATGTTIGERYEITQVVSENEHEHVYEVIDHKGYLRCWNCGSQENAEGNEFCDDCGAELLNAGYTMREYPSSKESEENVLQGALVDTVVENGRTYVIEEPQTLQSGPLNGIHIVASSASDVGVSRQGSPNEDSTLVLELERVHDSISSPAGIFLVSDGMGGHAHGEVASKMTTGIIASRVVHDLLIPPLDEEKAGKTPQIPDGERLKEILRDAIDDANSAVCQANKIAKEKDEESDMGATLTGFMIVGDRAYIFNVGDSRTYMLRDGKLYQLTNDHSLVGQLVAGGLIEPEDVYTHPQRSQIYRSIGDKLNVQIDVTEQVIHPGDILLSCSDGLWEMVRDPQITDILNSAPDPQAACTQLIEAANKNGGEDNISAVVAFVR